MGAATGNQSVPGAVLLRSRSKDETYGMTNMRTLVDYSENQADTVNSRGDPYRYAMLRAVRRARKKKAAGILSAPPPLPDETESYLRAKSRQRTERLLRSNRTGGFLTPGKGVF